LADGQKLKFSRHLSGPVNFLPCLAVILPIGAGFFIICRVLDFQLGDEVMWARGGGTWRLALRLAGSCVVAFALDNLVPRGSFLLGMVPLLPLVFFINLPFGTACVATFIGGLLVDSIHLSIPFGFSAVGGVGMLLFLRIFHVYFNRDIKERWMVILIAYAACYYILLGCILPSCHLLSFLLAMAGSTAYDYLLWQIVFYEHGIIHSPNMRIRYK
jgi:hypothetical protein